MSDTETLSLGSTTPQVTLTTLATGKQLVATSNDKGFVRNIRINLSLGSGISFHYGIQSGRGGFRLDNSSSVTGNVFSSGPITGLKENLIRGDVISAGPDGLIQGIVATGTAYAHTILDSKVHKDAYYTVIDSETSSNVDGIKHPNSPDQPYVPLPISDEQIEEWKDFASTGTTYTCTSGSYTISSDKTIGPAVIPCDLNIRGATVTISGPIWVKGNINITNTTLIRMAPSLGSENVAVIADNEANRISSSRITIGNQTSFQGSGSANSFVFLISQNSSAEQNNPSTPYEAITMNNGASALVAYASHGLISLAQSVSVKEVTAYRITLRNSSNVIYDTGLPSVLFKAGPGGSYEIIDWIEY